MKKLGGTVALVIGLLFAYGTIGPALRELSSGSFDLVHVIVWLFTGGVSFWLLTSLRDTRAGMREAEGA